MSIYLAGSGVLTALQLGSMTLTARHNRWGWALRIGSNLAAIPYNLITGQYFFVLAACGGIVVAARAFRARGWAYHGACASCEEMVLGKLEAAMRASQGSRRCDCCDRCPCLADYPDSIVAELHGSSL